MRVVYATFFSFVGFCYLEFQNWYKAFLSNEGLIVRSFFWSQWHFIETIWAKQYWFIRHLIVYTTFGWFYFIKRFKFFPKLLNWNEILFRPHTRIRCQKHKLYSTGFYSEMSGTLLSLKMILSVCVSFRRKSFPMHSLLWKVLQDLISTKATFVSIYTGLKVDCPQ